MALLDINSSQSFTRCDSELSLLLKRGTVYTVDTRASGGFLACFRELETFFSSSRHAHAIRIGEWDWGRGYFLCLHIKSRRLDGWMDECRDGKKRFRRAQVTATPFTFLFFSSPSSSIPKQLESHSLRDMFGLYSRQDSNFTLLYTILRTIYL